MKIMLPIVAVLLILVLITRVDLGGSPDIPTPDKIDEEVDAIRDLRVEYEKTIKEQNKGQNQLSKLQEQVEPFWLPGNREPAAEVQSEFEKIARRARVTIQTIGSPRVEEMSENVRAVELTVRIRSSMRELSRLLVEMEKMDPPLHWTSCTIRPDHPREPKGVMLSGKIRALVLSPEASRLIQPGEDET